MQAFARVVGGVLSFLAIFVMTYLFDEREIGEYNLVLSTVNIIASLGTLWLSQSILRFYTEKRDLGAVIILTGLSSIISILVYYLFNLCIKQTVSIWPFAYILLLVLYNVFDAAFRRERKLRSYVLMELLLAVGRIFPMVFLSKITGDYNSIFASQCIVVFLFFIILIIYHLNEWKNITFWIKKEMLVQYIHFGVPLMGLAISNWFLTTSDRYIIKFFGNSEQVGIYSTNYSLANSIYMMFSLIVVNAFHPIIMKEWIKSKENTLKLVSSTIELYLLLMVPLTVYGCLKSDILLGLFKGNLYADHFSVFNWTAIGIFFYGISLLFHKYYELTEKTNRILFINIIAALFNIALNFLLIPKMGFEIAAFTTFLAYILYIVIVRILTHKDFNIRINLKHLLLIVSIAAIFCVIDKVCINNKSVAFFFVEGAVYVIYTLIAYQILKLIDLRKLITKYF